MERPDHHYRGFFDYSRPQQLALGLVGLLILLFYGLGRWYPFQPPEFVADAELVAQAMSFHQAGKEKIATTYAAPESFSFDPNTVTEAELLRLGLRPDQAGSWLRYRGDRTNTFKRPRDIARLYKLDSADVARLLPLIVMEEPVVSKVARSVATAREAGQPTYENFIFDPNTVSQAELRRLGLSERQAAGFLKFRAKASPFRSAADLDRLRLLNEETKARLRPLVRIETAAPDLAVNSNRKESDYPDNEQNPAGSATGPATYGGGPATPQPYRPPPAVALASLDINTATSSALQELRGIGAYRADRIIKFREALGGFSSIEQLGTTYGLPDSTFQDIGPYLLLDTPIYRKLMINSLPVEALAKHPYLTFKQARAIVSYRANHGPYRSLSDLGAVRILREDDLQRLGPYLDFGE